MKWDQIYFRLIFYLVLLLTVISFFTMLFTVPTMDGQTLREGVAVEFIGSVTTALLILIVEGATIIPPAISKQLFPDKEDRIEILQQEVAELKDMLKDLIEHEQDKILGKESHQSEK